MKVEELFDLAMGISKHLQECPNCNGYGSSLKESASTCTMCNGSGAIKKEDR